MVKSLFYLNCWVRRWCAIAAAITGRNRSKSSVGAAESAVEFCFEIMRKDTVAENCQLHFIHLPAIAWCWQCQKEVEIEAYQDCCPHCHSACLQRRSGTEFRVKEIAVK